MPEARRKTSPAELKRLTELMTLGNLEEVLLSHAPLEIKAACIDMAIEAAKRRLENPGSAD